MSSSPVNLILTPELRAWRVPHPSQVCVVTFGELLDPPTLDRAGFGEAFFDAEKIDAVHVVSAGNDWYQYADMPEVLAGIREAIEPGRRVVTYGSSMGGYAAIRFSGALGASAAIAISPQYSLDRQLVPFERRWRLEAERVVFAPRSRDEANSPATIIYDPFNPDRHHVDLWAGSGPVNRLPLPFAGHPAATYLAEVGLLSSTIRELLNDESDVAAIAREARSRRRRSGKYLMTLASAQPRHRRRCMIPLTRMAVQAKPETTDYVGRLAILLYLAGDFAESESWHQRALALAPPSDHASYFRYSRFLQRMERFDESLRFARLAARAHPRSGALRKHVRRLERLTGPLTPLGCLLLISNRTAHLYSQLAWRRGWPLLGRLGTP